MHRFLTKSLMAVLMLCISTAVIARQPKVRRQPPAYTSSTTLKSHPYTDLGLSVMWADCNMGALSPSDIGSYYSWGELKPKKEFYDSLCVTWEKNFDYTEIAGDTLYDAAAVKWGATWRLPTSAEIQALIDSCKWEASRRDGIDGYRVTGPSGRSIFLPAGGFKVGSVALTTDAAYYWSAEPIGTRLAAVLLAEYGEPSPFSFSRSAGLPIRPVCTVPAAKP